MREHARRNAQARADKEAEKFNRTFKVGEAVNVRRDDGSIERRCIRSEAWGLSSGDAIVSVQGISGGYLCERLTKADDE